MTRYHRLLILTGTDDWYSARKTFSAPENPGDKPSLIKDYNLGLYFCWHEETLVEGLELESLQEMLHRLGDEPRSLLVAGVPMPWLVKGEVIMRRKEWIDDGDGRKLVKLDIDGWKTNIPWWESSSMLQLAISSGLQERGLDYLASKKCVVMLTQGAWPGHDLKCRVYYWAEEPIQLEDQRRWQKVVNARLEEKALDPVICGQVQPDYISRRECVGFDDPISAAQRVTLLSGDPFVLDERSIIAGIREEMKDEATYEREGKLDTDLVLTGDGWETLALSGTGSQINEYGYRAAAKIVSSMGRKEVEENLDALAMAMHERAWAVIESNSNGTRGGRDDAETYTIARYRQYLYSAAEKDIGGSLDKLVAKLDAALEEGVIALLSGEVVGAAAKLKKGWLGHYSDFRDRVVKAKIVRIGDFDDAVKRRMTKAEKKRRVSEVEQLEALEGVDGRIPLGSLINDEGNLIDNLLIEYVAASYDPVRDSRRRAFIVKSEVGSEDGGFTVLDDFHLDAHIGVMGREVLKRLNPGFKLPLGFVKAVVETIEMWERTALKMCTDDRLPSSIFGQRDIATRGYSTPHALWYNVGLEADKKFRCLRCTEDGIERMTWEQALNKFDDAPIWDNHLVVPFGHNDPNGIRDAAIVEDGLKHSAEGAWTRDLFKLVRVDSPDQEVLVLTWLMATILRWDTRFILQINGEKGAGKSTTGDMLCALADPVASHNLLKEHNKRRIMVDSLADDKKLWDYFTGREAVMIDNIDGLTSKQQDNMCMIATGIGLQREKKYSHVKLRSAIRASMILSGINPGDTREDFGDRTFTISIRKADFIDIHSEFERLRERIVSGLLRMAMRVRGELKTMNAWDRKAIVHAAAKVYIGNDGERVLELNERAGIFHRFMADPFAQCFAAWLQHDKKSWGDNGELEGKWLGITEMYEAYTKWYDDEVDNFGREEGLLVELNGASNFHLNARGFTGSRRHSRPKSVAAFGRKLNRTLTDSGVLFPPPTSVDSRILHGYKQRMIKTVDTYLI